MIYLSASAIKDFMVCPARYYYRRFFADAIEPSIYIIRGNIVHEAIEKFWDNKKGADDFARMRLESLEVPLPKKESDNIFRYIDSFFFNFEFLLTNDDKIEERFDIPLNKDVTLVGKFDRIVYTNGNYLVLDWKTSERPPSSIGDDPQFILYHYAFTKLYGAPPLYVAYCSLPTGKLIHYKYNKTLEDQLLMEVIPYMVNHVNEQTYPKLGLFNPYSCNYCTYKGICFNELDSRDISEKL